MLYRPRLPSTLSNCTPRSDCTPSCDDAGGVEDRGLDRVPRPSVLREFRAHYNEAAKRDVPEEELHIVDWAALAREIWMNGMAVVAFVAFVFVADLQMLVALPLYLLSLFLSALLVEVAAQLMLELRTAVVISLLALSVVGCALLGAHGFCQAMARFAWLPMLLSVMALKITEHLSDNWWLRRTAAWQAISGEKFIGITCCHELTALLKSVVPKSPRHGHGIWQRVREHVRGCVSEESSVVVDTVHVEDAEGSTLSLPVVIGGEELEPRAFVLSSLALGGARGGTRLSIRGIERELQFRRRIQDKVLLAWAADKRSQSSISPGDDDSLETRLSISEPELCARLPSEDLSRVSRRVSGSHDVPDDVAGWVQRAAAALSAQPGPRGGRLVVVGRLARRRYREGLEEHWAARAALCVARCCLLALPAAQLLLQVDVDRHQVCDSSSELGLSRVGPRFVGETLFCDGPDAAATPCDDACGSYLAFLGTAHAVFHVSPVEVLAVLALGVVGVLLHCVRSVARLHRRLERAHLRSGGSATAAPEAIEFIRAIGDVVSLRFVFDRLWDAVAAWTGTDPSLTACGSVPRCSLDGDGFAQTNDCLRAVTEPVRREHSGVTSHNFDHFIYGIGDPDMDHFGTPHERKPDEAPKTIWHAWQDLKEAHGLGSGMHRDYSVSFQLKMHNSDAVGMFMSWLELKYKEQLDHIFDLKNPTAQDMGRECHLLENTQIDHVLLPRGFSLTHLYVQSMPDDGEPHVVEVPPARLPGDKPAELQHNFLQAFSRTHELFGCFGGDALNDILIDHPVVARFALSEQYFLNMSRKDVALLTKDHDLRQVEDFTSFVDCMLQPMRVPALDKNQAPLFSSSIRVSMGDESPLRALLLAACRFAGALSVYVVCGVIAMVLPMLRSVAGGELFPAHFAFWMALNAVCVWILLADFFQTLQQTTRRLVLVGRCLRVLDQGLLTRRKADLDRCALDASMRDIGHCRGPSAEDWRGKRDRLSDWQAAASHLRVCASTSRVMAAAVLAVAAAILLGLLFAAISQGPALGSHGPGAATAAALDDAAALGRDAALRLRGDVAAALAAIGEARGAAAGVAAGRAAAADRAAGAWAAELGAVRASLHEVLLLQSRAVAEGHRALGAASVAAAQPTELQALTLAMTLALLLYSVPLVCSIVKVNWYVEHHEDLVLKQRELHGRHMHSRSRPKLFGRMAFTPGGRLRSGMTPMCLDDAGEREAYEKMVDVAAASAKKTGERFPLRLLGLAVTAQVLAVWCALAAAPAAVEAWRLGPALAMAACTGLRAPAPLAPGAADLRDAECAPLGEVLQGRSRSTEMYRAAERLDRLNRDVERTMAASGAPTPRRLLQAPRAAPGAAAHRDLAGAARRWWRAHSEAHPEARYAVARQALLELRRRGDLLLGMAPAEVVRAFHRRSPWTQAMPVAWPATSELGHLLSAEGAVRAHLEAAAVEMRSEEPGAVALSAGAAPDL